MRLFVAVDIENRLKEKISAIIHELQKAHADVKWVGIGQLHITLKFLGELREPDVKEIVKRLETIANGFPQFQMGLQGVGFFGNEKYVRTVWIGVQQGNQELAQMMKLCEQELGQFKKGDYEPKPHLTIGRVAAGRNRDALLRGIQNQENREIGTMPVRQLVLKQSVLTSTGPVYTDLQTFSIKT